MKEGYLKPSERKKILLLCDDIRVPSGVATVGREFVTSTCHRYNFLNLGAAIDHPDAGKRIDVSADFNSLNEIEDAQVHIIPYNGYGDPQVIRELLKIEKPDAIFLITDPRYWVWLFEMENEIRKVCPIVYLNIWDDYPAPLYNKDFYDSCDALLGISKQTVNINKLVLGELAENKVIKYVPHGINEKLYYPIDEKHEKWGEFQAFKKRLLGDTEYDTVFLFNSRNIRRKQVPDTILAYRMFTDQLPPEEAKRTALVLHTQRVDNNGTDLNAVVELFETENMNVVFSDERLPLEHMTFLYNLADATVLLTSNEGWGLALTESLLSGTAILANVTGGMQDQMRFVGKDGKWFTPDADLPSNHRGTLRKHGEWAFPVFPTSISLVGSVPTPYIWDDRCQPEDAAAQMMNVHILGREEMEKRGDEGRKWATGKEAGFTSKIQGERIIEALEELWSTWEPRKNYTLTKVTKPEKRTIPHKILY